MNELYGYVYVCRWPNGVVVFDVVFVGYLVVIIVVLVDTCCCCVLIIHGDILVFRNYIVVCYAVWPIEMMML